MTDFNITQRGREFAGERAEFRLYFAVLYPFALVATLAGRIVPSARPFDGIRVGRRSVFEDTARTLNSILPWAFMGR